jgi:hypothetical protein
MSSKKITALPGKKPLHNPALPKVSITLNGNDYVMEYDFNAICTAEELTGINMFGSFDFQRLSTVSFRAMLFATLLHNHPDMTLEQVGPLITAKSLPEITIKMVEAWHGSRPEVVEEAKGNAEAEEVSDPQSN